MAPICYGLAQHTWYILINFLICVLLGMGVSAWLCLRHEAKS